MRAKKFDAAFEQFLILVFSKQQAETLKNICARTVSTD
jgi:hypothetical protein